MATMHTRPIGHCRQRPGQTGEGPLSSPSARKYNTARHAAAIALGSGAAHRALRPIRYPDIPSAQLPETA
jgi:hypothetical protein